MFADGQCHDFALAGLKAEIPKAECGGNARVFKANQALAPAYPESRTTYRVTQ